MTDELIRRKTGGALEQMELIREKWGVYVYRGLYDGQPAVVKYFENEGDRREIANYRLLQEIGVPVMQVFSLGEEYIVMEDIGASVQWRLGAEEDMSDPSVLRALAKWYFALHEGGEGRTELQTMWSENDGLDAALADELERRIPEAEEFSLFLREYTDRIRKMVRRQENTVVYNDFYYTNLLVKKDKSAAMMFDYNCMGRGYRYADWRNVRSSVSQEAFEAFEKEYGALYAAKYGKEYKPAQNERKLDEFLSPVLALASALKREKFPVWAEDARREAVSGELKARGEELLGYAQRGN